MPFSSVGGWDVLMSITWFAYKTQGLELRKDKYILHFKNNKGIWEASLSWIFLTKLAQSNDFL